MAFSRRTRLKAAQSIRKVRQFFEKTALRTKSRAAQKSILYPTRFLQKAVGSSRPPKRFFPGEVFIPLSALSKRGPESEYLFREIKKLNFWKKHEIPIDAVYRPMLSGIIPVTGGLIAVAAGGLFSRPVDFGVGMGGMVISILGGTVASNFLKSKTSTAKEKFNSALSTMQRVIENTPQAKALRGTKKYNFLMVDFENKGIRLCQLPPKTMEFVKELGKHRHIQGDLTQRIIVLDKNGLVVYPKPNQLGEIIAAPERRTGEKDRRSGGDPLRDRRKNSNTIQHF